MRSLITSRSPGLYPTPFGTKPVFAGADAIRQFVLIVAVLTTSIALSAYAAVADEPSLPPVRETARGERMIADYFRRETKRITRTTLSDIQTKADWLDQRGEFRQQLFEMLGLDPLPERTPLQATVTGTAERDGVVVENLHFQSRPGLYVTGNLYRPAQASGKLPTILYVCGHGGVKIAGISYGNKVHYQHHGAWFARNGYVCLAIDTLQLGEIEGIHHGTYRENMWWWNARGYTSAGVEAWNCMRAIDYLQSRPDVDGDRIGITGRSGGGAYSWWTAALDERVKVAVPVAGITSLKNHVVDGCVEGHCDCMYQVNTYGQDFPLIAALVAPRPLLISNTDKDRIFPLDGVVDVHRKTRRIYELLGAEGNLGLHITEGPHKDTQELRIHAFHWFNRFLKGTDPLIETAAVPLFEPAQLRVFHSLPADQINTRIQESFTQVAPPPVVPESPADWAVQRDNWMQALRDKCFRSWPDRLPIDGDEPAAASESNSHQAPSLTAGIDVERAGIRLRSFTFVSQEPVELTVYVAHRSGLNPADADLTVLNVVDDDGWTELVSMLSVGFVDDLTGEPKQDPDRDAFDQTSRMFASFPWVMAWVAPRGFGPTLWDTSQKHHTQIRRRFMLLGQTLDSARVWDVRRSIQALRQFDGIRSVPLWLQAEDTLAGVTLYASLFEPEIARLDLHDLPASHHSGPIFLNVQRFLDMPAAVALATERSKVRLYGATESDWHYPAAIDRLLNNADSHFQLQRIPPTE